MKNNKKILLVNPFAIGDILSSTSLIEELRRKFPHCFIGYMCNRRVASIVESNPKIDEVFIFEKNEYKKRWRVSRIKCIWSFLKFLRLIQKKKFNLVIDLSLGDRYSFFFKLLGIPKRVGFNYKGRGRFQTHKLDIPGFEEKHVVEYYFELLKFIGIDGKPPPLKAYLKEDDIKWAEEFLKDNNVTDNDLLIGIDPAGGESFGPQADIKRWPIEYFAALSDQFISQLNAKIIILVGPKEKEVVDKIRSLMQYTPIDASQSSIMQMAALMKKSSLIICNDTGPMRFANAFEKKVVALFGPTDDKVYGCYPSHERNRVLKKENLSCRPCYKKFRIPKCEYNKRCLTEITVDEVFEAGKNLLSG
ncbi:MAG: glycosyltransferase family 9 protein [Candidatus Omnitrophica bacterium]|nr:glycosyltransferase family 9 protein [Candidatus Omnitrophota bacterium]